MHLGEKANMKTAAVVDVALPGKKKKSKTLDAIKVFPQEREASNCSLIL